MSELTLQTRMSKIEYSFLWAVGINPELLDKTDVPPEIRSTFNNVKEGTGIELKLMHSDAIYIVVVFHLRAVDVRNKHIAGTIEVRQDLLQEHLDRLGIKPKRAFIRTFSPLLDSGFTLHATLQLLPQGKVEAKVVAKPNISLWQ